MMLLISLQLPPFLSCDRDHPCALGPQLADGPADSGMSQDVRTIELEIVRPKEFFSTLDYAVVLLYGELRPRVESVIVIWARGCSRAEDLQGLGSICPSVNCLEALGCSVSVCAVNPFPLFVDEDDPPEVDVLFP